MSFNRTTVATSGVANAVVCKGDRTSHGGVVIQGTSAWTENGSEAALSGFKVYCPKCKPHIHTITRTSSQFPVHEIGDLALNGDLTSCGATLIAESASASLMGVAQALINGNAHDEQFQALNDLDGQPLEGMAWYAETESGFDRHGITDHEGKTARIITENAEIVKVYWGIEALAKIQQSEALNSYGE